MSIASISRPSGYRPGGKCDWLKLLTIAMPLSVLAAFVLAVVITPVFVTGICAIIGPVIAGAVLGCVAERLFRIRAFPQSRGCSGAWILAGNDYVPWSVPRVFRLVEGSGRHCESIPCPGLSIFACIMTYS